MSGAFLLAFYASLIGSTQAGAAETRFAEPISCSARYGLLMPDEMPKSSSELAVIKPASVPPARALQLPDRAEVGLEEKMVKNLATGRYNVLFSPDPSKPYPLIHFDTTTYLKSINPHFTAADVANPKKVRVFAKANKISVAEAKAALETYIEMYENLPAAARIYDRLIQRAGASFVRYVAAKNLRLEAIDKYAKGRERPSRLENGGVLLAITAGPYEALTVGLHHLAGYGSGGALLSAVVAAVPVTSSLALQLYRMGELKKLRRLVRSSRLFADTRELPKLEQIVKNQLRRGVFDQQLDSELEAAWGAWVKENRPLPHESSEIAMDNSQRLLSVAELSSYFHALELPNGTRFSDIFNSKAQVTPDVVQDMNDVLVRKKAQIAKMSEELQYVADSSERSLQTSAAANSQLKLFESPGGLNEVNALAVERKLSGLPDEMQLHLKNALAAHELETNLLIVTQQLNDFTDVINTAYDGTGSFNIDVTLSGKIQKAFKQYATAVFGRSGEQ